MKLVELLARELEKWPKPDREKGPIESMSQAGDLQVSHYSGVRQVWREDVHDWSGHDYVPCSRFKLPELATDHATAIVTRADWESEKALIVGKADDGWKRHRGGKCPVDRVTPVEVRMRSGEKLHTFDAYEMRWSHNGGYGDIMAYRIHKPAEQPAPVSEEAIQVGIDAADAGKLTPIAEVKARIPSLKTGRALKDAREGNTAKFSSIDELMQDLGESMPQPKPCADPAPAVLVNPPDGPLEWRDRIRTLDTQRAELEATYQRQIGEIAKERGELVAQLKSEGLALVEVVQPVKSLDHWRNWKAGDFVEVWLANDSGLAIGSHHTVRSVEEEDYDGCMHVSVWIGEGDWVWPEAQDESGRCVFKFVSRPGK